MRMPQTENNHQALWPGTESPPRLLALRSNFMWVKPLSSGSQGHAFQDGDLIINCDSAGYHGEAFGTPSSLQHVEHLKP